MCRLRRGERVPGAGFSAHVCLIFFLRPESQIQNEMLHGLNFWPLCLTWLREKMASSRHLQSPRPLKRKRRERCRRLPPPSVCVSKLFFFARARRWQTPLHLIIDSSFQFLILWVSAFPLSVATPAPKAAADGDQCSAIASPMPRPLGVSRNANAAPVVAADDTFTAPSRLVS